MILFRVHIYPAE
jgi:hypothetical protein